MSVIRVSNTDVELVTLVTTPSRNYSSSSQGATGSVKVFPRQPKNQKDLDASFTFNDSRTRAVVESNLDAFLKQTQDASRSKRASKKSIDEDINNYVSRVDAASVKATDVLDVERFTPTTRLTKYTIRKNNVKDMLMPYYRVDYPNAHWAYTNYNTLNFFTAYDSSTSDQLIPTSSVLLYPNSPDPELPQHEGYTSGSYCLSGAFSFDFYVNPRYKSDGIDTDHFKAGTIFHLSSSYAVSLVTGSLKDVNGYPDGFRIQLQLSHSADISPSKALPGNYPCDLVFLSDDNSLRYNNWHHIVIRWGTNLINNGTGSFVVDGVVKGNFVIPSGTVSSKPSANAGNPDALCIGNFYEGRNFQSTAQSYFFGPDNALRDGVDQITADDTYSDPTAYTFSHPLKAEVHDLTIRRYFMSDAEQIGTGSRGIGVDAFSKKNIAFYVPPFFVQATPIRRWRGDSGGILQTPFFEIDGTTDDPFNVAMAFGVNGHYINLENFVKDFNTGRFPRLLNLTASTIDYTTTAQEANYFLYQDGGVSKRNLTVLPCDDGNFDPNYELLAQETLGNKYVDSSGAPDYSYINLDNLVTTASLAQGGIGLNGSEEMVTELYGANPENPGLPPGPAYKSYIAAVTASLSTLAQDEQFDRGVQKGVPLTIYQRTLDPSSNQVTFFNISNLYYGRRIQPGTFMIRDVGISGSYDSVGVTLRDDYLGNLYRADALTPPHKQSTVGNIFYDEGIVLIKSPHLYFFGKNQYEMSFRGVQNIYSSKYEILAGPGLLNSSSNATYMRNEKSLKPSSSPVDNETFVYISGINLHDENMNVVAKAKLAQPIIKREGDKILFKVAFDW